MVQESHGDAYTAVKMIYDKSPGRSWRRLNGALQDVLKAAITAHLTSIRKSAKVKEYQAARIHRAGENR